jgi:hypothetical protein
MSCEAKLTANCSVRTIPSASLSTNSIKPRPIPAFNTGCGIQSRMYQSFQILSASWVRVTSQVRLRKALLQKIRRIPILRSSLPDLEYRMCQL